MNTEIATAIVVGIATIGLMIWVIAIQVMLRATRERQAVSDEAARVCPAENLAATIAGSAEVPGEPGLLAPKFAQTLAHNGLGILGATVKITAADQNEIRFETAGTSLESIKWNGIGFRRGTARFSVVGNKTRIEYCVETINYRDQVQGGWLFIALGLGGILVGLFVEFAVVIPSQQLATRADNVFAMLISLILVWPPFILARELRRAVKRIRDQFEILIHNLPYT